MDNKLTLSDLKPITFVLYSIIIGCFSSYAMAETELVKNFAVFFLFVSVACLSVCVFFCQNKQQTSSAPVTVAAKKYFDDDIKQVLSSTSMGIKNDLEQVRKDLAQIKQLTSNATFDLTENFYSIASRLDQQRRIMEGLIFKCKDLATNRDVGQINMIHHLIKEDAGNCIRALQFEDITNQVSGHAALYLEDVEKYLANLQFMVDSLETGKPLNIPSTQIVDSLKTPDNKAQKHEPINRVNIAQQDLDAGRIELF